MKIIICLIVFTFSLNSVCAAKSPQVQIANKIYDPSAVIEIAIGEQLCISKVKVAITSDSGIAEIYDNESQSWVSGQNLWLTYYAVYKQFNLRFKNISEQKVEFRIKTLNEITGVETVSDPITVWVSDFQNLYIDRLNKNILTI